MRTLQNEQAIGSAQIRSTQIRWTPRGRRVGRIAAWSFTTVVVGLLVGAVILVIGAAFAPRAVAGDGKPTPYRSVDVVVGPGDTLWGLAAQHQPGRDPRDVVAQIEQANDLGSSGVLPVGTVVEIPLD